MLMSFPRPFAAASLKPRVADDDDVGGNEFSAAIRRGLIEASTSAPTYSDSDTVFRGHSPRPH